MAEPAHWPDMRLNHTPTQDLPRPGLVPFERTCSMTMGMRKPKTLLLHGSIDEVALCHSSSCGSGLTQSCCSMSLPQGHRIASRLDLYPMGPVVRRSTLPLQYSGRPAAGRDPAANAVGLLSRKDEGVGAPYNTPAHRSRTRKHKLTPSNAIGVFGGTVYYTTVWSTSDCGDCATDLPSNCDRGTASQGVLLP